MKKTQSSTKEKKWIVKNPGSVFISGHIHPEVVKLLVNRGVTTESEGLEFLDPDYEKLSDCHGLIDIDKAVGAIKESIKNNEKITIYGDYDVDGITSTVLLLKFFDLLGVKADYYIPNRQEEGYGLNKEAIKDIAKRGTKLLITVDCGSTGIDEVECAKELGLKVVITDHHQTKEVDGKEILPVADAIVNPKRKESEYAQELAGVGVSYFLVRALQTSFDNKITDGQIKWLLDLVAMGTICDIVPLTGDNRILTKFGLKVLAKTKNIGILALAKVANIDIREISSYHVGFLLGPRLNATGRLETADKAIELLLTRDIKGADKLAMELDVLNKERQELTEQIVSEARDIVSKVDDERKVHLLYNASWPAGVVGIVASRLVEEFAKPVLVMEDLGDELKGSARSIPGFNIIESLAECKEYLSHYGGHAFAAGFRLDKKHFILLENKLIEIASKNIKIEDLVPQIQIEGVIDLNKVDNDLLGQVKQLEPFGSGNPKPVFALMKAEIVDLRLVGNPSIHLKMTVKIGNKYISGIIFNHGEVISYSKGDLVDIACRLENNDWSQSIEFVAVDVRSHLR